MEESIKRAEESYTPQDIAEILIVCRNTVYNWIKLKVIPSDIVEKNKGRITIPKQKFDDWIESKTTMPKE